MKTAPRLFVSVPDDRYLDPRRLELKRAILGTISAQGFEIVGFEPEQFGTGLPVQLDAWSVDRALHLLRRCDGAVVLALARSTAVMQFAAPSPYPTAPGPVPLPSPYNHLEGALAVSLGLPVLLFREQGMEASGIFASGTKPIEIPAQAGGSWTLSQPFQDVILAWRQRVAPRRDVFLGYCSRANAVAADLREHMEDSGFAVLDWARDFAKGGATILDEIERASQRCRCAVFLFTRDDELLPAATAKADFDAVPRDNVLLEAGYFTRSHGKSRVAIIRESGARMPADLGGIIYLGFDDRKALGPLKQDLVSFLDRCTAPGNAQGAA